MVDDGMDERDVRCVLVGESNCIAGLAAQWLKNKRVITYDTRTECRRQHFYRHIIRNMQSCPWLCCILSENSTISTSPTCTYLHLRRSQAMKPPRTC
jgi:hypothetical protein